MAKLNGNGLGICLSADPTFLFRAVIFQKHIPKVPFMQKKAPFIIAFIVNYDGLDDP